MVKIPLAEAKRLLAMLAEAIADVESQPAADEPFTEAGDYPPSLMDIQE